MMSFLLDPVGFCGLSSETWMSCGSILEFLDRSLLRVPWALGFLKKGFAFGTRTLRASEGIVAALTAPAGNADLHQGMILVDC